MWQLLVMTVALVQSNPAEFKAGWEKAKARAALRDQFRHGLIDGQTLLHEQLKLMTPQEEAEVWKVLEQEARRLDENSKRHEANFQRLKESHELWHKKHFVGPLTEAEERRLAELRRISAEELQKMRIRLRSRNPGFVGPPPPSDTK